MSTVDVSIIIVSWNTRDILRGCLRSVYEQTSSIAVEIIVIDNASGDGTAKMVREEFPSAILIENPQNRGFAAANNQGMAVAKGRYVLLLNPDTIVLVRAIDKAVAYADLHPDVGVVGCQVWEDENTVQPTCLAFPSVWNLMLQELGLRRLFPRSRVFGRGNYGWWDRTSEQEVDVVSGMFMLVRQEAIAQVGLMDEDYFVYAEETDWCHRFKRAGWRCMFTPEARIVHLDGGSKSSKQASVKMLVQQKKSLLIFFRKRLGWSPWVIARGLLVVSQAGRGALWGALWLVSGRIEARHRWLRSWATLRFLFTGAQP